MALLDFQKTRWPMACVAIVAIALTFPAAASKKYALLIGVNKPHVQTKGIAALEFPDKDVAALTAVLRRPEYGYDVIDLTRHRTKRQDILIELYSLARTITPEDEVIVYFSGHGARNFNGRIYWITYDTDISIMDHNGIRLDHLMEYVIDLKAARKLVLLDHCYAGELADAADAAAARTAAAAPAAAAAAPPVAEPPPTVATRETTSNDNFEIRKRDAIPEDEYGGYVAPPVSAKGLVVFAASSNEAVEVGGNVKHGVFTYVLLKALETREADTTAPRDGKLSVTELGKYLLDQVPIVAAQAGGVMQRPRDYYRGDGIGNWIIGSLPVSAAEAPERARAMKNELRRWANAGYLPDDVRIIANDVIEKWQAAQAANIPLAGEDARLWRYVSAAFENNSISAEKRARTLNEDVTSEGFLPQRGGPQNPPGGAQ